MIYGDVQFDGSDFFEHSGRRRVFGSERDVIEPKGTVVVTNANPRFCAALMGVR
jgi:hypothetical protein